MSKLSEYRDMTVDKLQKQVADEKKRLQKLINQQASDPSDDVREKKNLRREIARMLTVLNEKQGEA